MIGIFDDDGNRLAITFNSPVGSNLVLNNPADPEDDTYQVNTVSIAEQLDFVSDPHPNRDGLEVYAPRKVQKLLVIEGVIHAPTLAKLFDKKHDLVWHTDPALAVHAVGPAYITRELDFYRPTTDTTNFPTGLMHLVYKVQARTVHFPTSSMYTGNSCLFRLEFMVPDPLCYAYSSTTITSFPYAGALTTEFPVWPTYIHWQMASGAGSASFTFTINGYDMVFNMSGYSGTQHIYVYPDTREIRIASTDTPSVLVSGTWDSLLYPTGGCAIDFSNTTNTTGHSVILRPAWVA